MADKIRKTARNVNFTTVSNDFLQDVNLSWKAKGMIVYILSLPPDWELNLSDLKNRSKDGRDSTAAGLRELMDNGYCKRIKLRSDGGTFGGYDYVVSDIKEFELEQPQTDNPVTVEPQPEKPNTDNPNMEKPDTVNPTQVNTNSNKDLNTTNTNDSGTPQNTFASLFPDEQKVEETKDKKTLFRNSEVYKLVLFENGVAVDYSEFEKKFAGAEFERVDLVYYFHSVSDWSDQKNMKRTKNGWLATIRNFIRGDVEKKKLHLKQEYQSNKPKLNVAGAMEYLKDDY